MIEKALELLKPFHDREEAEISDVCWIEKDDESMDESYCRDCIRGALDKLTIKFPDSEFMPYSNDFGPDEDERFEFCDECGKRLEVSIIPTEEEFDHWLSEDFEIDDEKGYELYELLDASGLMGGKFDEEAERLAGIVIEKLEGGPK